MCKCNCLPTNKTCPASYDSFMTILPTAANIFALREIMINTHHDFLSDFCIAGINYRKSDVIVRGKFSLTTDQCELLLNEVVKKHIPGAFVLSTCNRTEIYGISSAPQELIELLCLHTQGRIKDFIEHGYTHRGLEAVEHLFKMAAGIDSQIIGDHEILSQLKMAAKFAKTHKCINNFLERVINFSIESSKRIKTETRLSSGTVSVSYAAIEIIKDKIPNLTDKKVLLVGTGKIGNNIAGNITTYLPDCSLSFCNRTDEKASALAAKCKAEFIAYENLPATANDADVVIVSTSSETYTVLPSFFTKQKARLILDLSIPQNVDPAVKSLAGIELMNVDEISAILNKTINKRKEEIPKALQIINETINDLQEWYGMQVNNPVLRKIKSHLNELSEDKTAHNKEKIHKTVSTLAKQLKKENNKGCQYIHALNNHLGL
ncbi:MAG: glutamyl-tRNA reductase [Bacteroidota bacterium]|nr:glutamyl-tRNA reductase [Bacteroidota bacterium]